MLADVLKKIPEGYYFTKYFILALRKSMTCSDDRMWDCPIKFKPPRLSHVHVFKVPLNHIKYFDLYIDSQSPSDIAQPNSSIREDVDYDGFLEFLDYIKDACFYKI